MLTLLVKSASRDLSEISIKNIDQYLDSLKVSPKTKKNQSFNLSPMIKQAIKEGILSGNPCELATLPKIKNKSVHRLLLPIDLEIIFNGAGA